MPVDLKLLFQKYGFLEYFIDHVDRVIFCRHITNRSGVPMHGFISPNGYRDNNEERLIYINSWASDKKGEYALPSVCRVYDFLHAMVHETAHKELQHLDEEGKTSNLYSGTSELTERYAYLKQLTVLLKMQQDKDSPLTELYYERQIQITRQIIERLNLKCGLEKTDYTLFPTKLKIAKFDS